MADAIVEDAGRVIDEMIARDGIEPLPTWLKEEGMNDRDEPKAPKMKHVFDDIVGPCAFPPWPQGPFFCI